MSLDDALAAWAATVRLSPAEADEIYQRIVAAPGPARTPPPGLDPGWWRRFSAGFTSRMIASTRPVPVAWPA
jgi:hypothetical protein